MNYISVNNKQIALTDDQAEAIIVALKELGGIEREKVMLSDIPVGEIVKIAGMDMVVLEQMGIETALITKNLLDPLTAFSENNNNYTGSLVDEICESFAELLEDAVGADNVMEHDVDLISDDGLKDYGIVRRKASLITADMYRRYVEILDQYRPEKWWWLTTPHSTERHDNNAWVKCVSPSGYLFDDHFYDCVNGVRPFCILKSDIFVSR